LLVSTLSSCWLFYQPTLDIQGHRGARGLFPENTLIGFRKTIEMDVTTLELDLGLTKGLVPVVTHDPYLNQNLCLDSNGYSIATDTLGYGPLISNLTLKEIKTFDCGSLNPDVLRFPQPPRKNIPGEKIPTLQEVCNKFRVACSTIGHVKNDKMMHVKKAKKTLALLPAEFVARAPLLDRKKTKPKYLLQIKKENRV